MSYGLLTHCRILGRATPRQNSTEELPLQKKSFREYRFIHSIYIGLPPINLTCAPTCRLNKGMRRDVRLTIFVKNSVQNFVQFLYHAMV